MKIEQLDPTLNECVHIRNYNPVKEMQLHKNVLP